VAPAKCAPSKSNQTNTIALEFIDQILDCKLYAFEPVRLTSFESMLRDVSTAISKSRPLRFTSSNV